MSPLAPSSVKQDLNGQKELCPRLCHLKKGPNGYGFNLHSEKSRPGQFIRSVDPDSPASRAGLRPQDRLVEVTPRGLSTPPREALWGALGTCGAGMLSPAQPGGGGGSCPPLTGGEGAAEAMGPLGSLNLRQPPVLCPFLSDSPIFLYNMEP